MTPHPSNFLHLASLSQDLARLPFLSNEHAVLLVTGMYHHYVLII